MTAIAKKTVGAMDVVRPGEGTYVDLHVTPVDSVNGRGLSRFTADIASIPVPAKRYSADLCFVGFSRDTVKVLFAQERYGSAGELRTLLIVKMTPASVSRFLESVDQANPPFVVNPERPGLASEVLPEFTQEPKDTVTLDANFILAGMHGREACCDFYHASPFSMGASAKLKKLAVDPVVRVDLRSTLLMAMIKALREQLGSLPQDMLKEG